MADEHTPEKKPAMLEQVSVLKLLVGILIGGVTMWWSLHDRIAKQVEDEVTIRVNTATKLARIEERLFAAETKQKEYDQWQRTHTDRLNAVFGLIGKTVPAENPGTVSAPTGK